ncbi:NADP-dependent oxidoreductase domain-containing protein [Colletotrichum cereale]|nr:NADP-dependent oxidoreductase domain-containing protein [Colletotrichum cereale]
MEYVRLGNTGLKISKIILGCTSFGSSKWEGSPWVLDEEDGLQLLKAVYENGINTWDTADTYSNGESEVIIDKALKKFNIPRQKVVILSKIFNPVMDDGTRPPSINDGPLVNQMGLRRKHIFHAVDQCLQRLGKDYIDVLQIHRLDRETPPEEIMRAFHDVVQSGKVRYIGASSMYTWEFARLQYIARSNGWTEFISMQPFYNLLYREEDQTDKKTQTWFADVNLDIVNRVEEVAKKRGVSMALASTGWILQKGCCSIVGLTSVERIKDTVGALELKLTEEECQYLESEYRPRNIQGM